MKILVTGGCGFIGRHITEALINDNQVIVVDDMSRGKVIPEGVTFINSDLSKDTWDSYFENVDVVIHLASRVGSMDYYRNSEYNVLDTNTSIDKNVIRSAIKYGVKYFINASSAHVYGLSDSIIKEEEAWTKKPPITYGTAKLLSEELLRTSGMLSVSLRLVGIYGSGQDPNPARGSLIPVLCKKALDAPGKPYGILTNGKESRTYCYIDDAVSAMIKCLNYMVSTKESLPPMNIGSSRLYTVAEIASEVLSAACKNVTTNTTNVEANIKTQACDSLLAKKLINWEAETSLSTGIKKTYNWFRSVV